MLHKSFNSAKCKTSLKLASSRIKLLRNKRQNQVKALRNDVAQLLQTDQTQTAMIRVEHVMREAKTMAAYDLLAVFCEQIALHMNLIESQKNCPNTLKEAIASLIFAAPRCSDITELEVVSKQLTRKYGKEFTKSILEVRPDSGVSRKLMENLAPKTTDGPTKVKNLTAIAEEHNIKWVYKAFDDTNDAPSSSSNFMGQSSSHDVYVKQTPMNHETESHEQNISEALAEKQQAKENLGSGKWKTEFKDAAEAAQAAAESAQLASMAAKAAVELSRNQSWESKDSEKNAQPPLEKNKSEVKYEEITDEEMIARFNRLKKMQNSNVKESFEDGSAVFSQPVMNTKQNSIKSSTSPPVNVMEDIQNSKSERPVKAPSFIDEDSVPQTQRFVVEDHRDNFFYNEGVKSETQRLAPEGPHDTFFDAEDIDDEDAVPETQRFISEDVRSPVFGQSPSSGYSSYFTEESAVKDNVSPFVAEDHSAFSYDKFSETDEPIFDEPDSTISSGEKDELFSHHFDKKVSFDKPSSPFVVKRMEEAESEFHEQISVTYDESESSGSETEEEPNFDEHVIKEESSAVEGAAGWFDGEKLSGGRRNKGNVRPLFIKEMPPLPSDEIDADTEMLLNKEIKLPSDSTDDDEPPKPKSPEATGKEILLSSDSSEEDELPKPKSPKRKPKISGESSRKNNYFESDDSEDEKAVSASKPRLKNIPSRRTKANATPIQQSTSVRKQSLPSMMKDEEASKRTSGESFKAINSMERSSSKEEKSFKAMFPSEIERSSSIERKVPGHSYSTNVQANKKPSWALATPTAIQEPIVSVADIERSSSIEKRGPKVSHDKKPSSSRPSEAAISITSMPDVERSASIGRKEPRVSQGTNDRQTTSLMGRMKPGSPLVDETTTAPALQEFKKPASSSKDKKVYRDTPDVESTKSSSSSSKEGEASRVAPEVKRSNAEIDGKNSEINDTTEEKLSKRASHVHPKLPDYDDFTKVFLQNRS